MTATNDVVFLLDVDNTLLDNDRVQDDLRNHLEREFGAASRDRYWAIFEALRTELGYADYLGALQRYRLGDLSDPRLLQMSAFLVDYPFADRLYPGAIGAIEHLARWGPTVILSDGDVVFQPRKIQRSGLWNAVEGRVLIYIHKERMLEVVGLRENSPKPGRAPTGMAALRMTTIDQLGQLVLDFYRCAMLPLSPDADPDREHRADDLSAIGAQAVTLTKATAEWNADALRHRVPGPHFDPGLAGSVLHSSADVVSSAPELARLTLNIAAVHHDSRASGERLVYGGHTIGLALAQASRLLPNLVTVLGWQSCDHTGPVHEGDTLVSELHVEAAEPLPAGGGVLRLRSLVNAVGEADRPVLDWRFSALQF